MSNSNLCIKFMNYEISQIKLDKNKKLKWQNEFDLK